VRLGHVIVVFPGGVGTAEEILYILGVLLNEKNNNVKVPLLWTGPKSAEAYFQQLDEFIGLTLGSKAQDLYQIVIDDPLEVAQIVSDSMNDVHKNRCDLDDAFFYNWSLIIDEGFQKSFYPSHENMAKLNLNKNQAIESLAADIRRAFSGIVAGNVKPAGIEAIKQHGSYTIHGEAEIMQALDKLLKAFVEQRRMKISGQYVPCYELETAASR
jgi:predicted aspartyl protease